MLSGTASAGSVQSTAPSGHATQTNGSGQIRYRTPDAFPYATHPPAIAHCWRTHHSASKQRYSTPAICS